MNFTLNSTRLIVGALALSPALALAQASPNVVPPPLPPGTQQVEVAPALGVSSPNPASSSRVSMPAIDLALPSAPRSANHQGGMNPAPNASGLNVSTASPDSSLGTPRALPPIPVGSSSSYRNAVQVQDEAFAGMVVTPVSDSQLNRFVFPEPIEGIYFSEGAPLPECPDNAGAQDPCKPVFLNGKRMMLLQLRAGARGPAQMLVHLRSGRIVTMNLAPSPGPGAVIRIDGAEDGASDTRLAAAYRDGQGKASASNMSASEKNVEILSLIAKGELPPGFEPEGIGQTVRFEFFDVEPMAAWGNGDNLRAHMFQIKAHGNTPVAINSSLFRTPNVKALALDRETITKDEPAILYMLEFVQEVQ